MSKKKVFAICGAVLVLSILAEVLLVHHHGHNWWHNLIGFDVIFGFAGCVFLIVFSKFLGKRFIQRVENYYEGGEESND